MKTIEKFTNEYNYRAYLKSIDGIRKDNVRWAIENFDSEIIGNFTGKWVIVQDIEPRAWEAVYEPSALLHDLRTAMKLRPGSILIYAKYFSGLDSSVPQTHLILDINDKTLEGFI